MKWVSIKNGNPPKSGEYLVWIDKSEGRLDIQYFITCQYSKKHDAWNSYDSQTKPSDQATWQGITHWAKVTKPRRGK